MTILAATSEYSTLYFSVDLALVLFIGFVAAVVLGSIAWYNSKRPLGWQDKERPKIVPDVDR